MTLCLVLVSFKIPWISWDKHQQTFFPRKNGPLLSHKHKNSTVIHRDSSLWTSTQSRTDLVQIAGRLATRATGRYAHHVSSCVERASWLLCMPFWLNANYISLRNSLFFALSSSAGLPTSFRYHHLFTSTARNHSSTNTSASWVWNRMKQNDGHFIHYATHWDPTTMQTPLSSPWRCKCSHRKHDPGCTVKNCTWNRKQQEWEAACNRM